MTPQIQTDSTDSDRVQACPDPCDSTNLAPVHHKPHDYVCRECGARLDSADLVERERTDKSGLKGTPRRLEEMDPDAIQGGAP